MFASKKFVILCVIALFSVTYSFLNHNLNLGSRIQRRALSCVNTEDGISNDVKEEEEEDERIITLTSNARSHLSNLRKTEDTLFIRMGVRSGGCSGMSYAMDLMKEEEIIEEDHIENFDEIKVQCVIDPKSLLYIYGMELDYSDELIGGGFKFQNPNAETSCGCGKSFGV